MKNLISSNSFAKHLASSRGGYSQTFNTSTQPPTSVADRLLIGCSSVADRFLTMTSLCHRLAVAILLLFTFALGNAWGACEQGTLIFSMEVTSNPSSKVQIAAKSGGVNGSIDLVANSYVTVVGTSAVMYNSNSSAYDAITTAGEICFKNQTKHWIEISFPCALQAGDKISFTTSKTNPIAFSGTASGTKYSTTDNKLEISTSGTSELIGKTSLWIWRPGNEPNVKSLRIIRPLTITLDATTNGGTVSVTSIEGAIGDKVVLPHAFKSGKTFSGWFGNATGGSPKDNYYAINSDETIYAQFAAIPESGELFSLEMLESLKPAKEVSLDKGYQVDLLQYAAVSGGAAFACNTTSSSNHMKITTEGKLSFTGTAAYLKIDLDFALAEGDEIATDASAKLWISASATTSAPSSGPYVNGTNQTYVVEASDGLKNNSTIYIWRSSNATLTTITITRPAPAATYTVTLNPAGGLIDPVPSGWTLTAGQYVKSGIEDGSSVALLALTKEGYKLNGWKDGENADYTSPVTIDGADLTLTAQWAQTYAVTYAPNNGTEETMTDNNAPYKAGDEVTLLANTFTAPENKEFDAWVVTPTAGGDPITVTAGKFTMPAAAVTVTATWKDACAAAPTVSATTLGTTSYTTQVVNCAGISVLGSAGCTISEYGFVYGTSTAPTISDNKKVLGDEYTVVNTAFPATTLTGLAVNTKYYVRAYATNSYGTAYGEEVNFTTLAALGNVLFVASSASQTSDAITALRDNGFVVTVSAPNNSRDYTGYDLVVLDESLDGKNGVADKEEGDIKGVNIPILNFKAFFYTLSSRWNWGTPVNGTSGNEIANIPTTYKNAQSHPIFAGLTITDGAIDLIDPAKSGNTLQGITTSTLVEGKEGYTLATSGTGITFIHELTPAQRGVSTAKYLMIAISGNAKDNLSADGEKLVVNAAKYLVGNTAWVPQYYTVSFDPHGADPIAAQTGNPSITLPTPVNGTGSFLGWFTAATEGTKIGDAGDPYTPTADITLHAQWELISTDARLASITFSSDAGTLSPAFNPEVVNYTYTMPYPTASIPTITGATAVNANAQAPEIGDAAAEWGGSQIVRGVAESGDKKTYTITMILAPKDGVSIIKVATTGGTNKTVTGLYAGDGDVNLSSNMKMDNGKYIGFSLDGTTLQAGDRINVHTSTAANQSGSHIIFYDNMTDKNELYETGEIGGLGDNIFTINAAMVNKSTAYVYRSNADAAHQWNGYVDYLEVTRPMNPVLKSMTIDGRTVTINEAAKTATCTIPYASDLAALTIVDEVVWNAAAATDAKVVTSNSGNWVIGDNTLKLTDKDGDYTIYTITLSRDVLKHTVSFNTHGGSAVASEEVVHNGYLASAPADPTKEDYLFQYWSLSDGGSEVDVTTIQVDEDKTFHAVWAPDGAIKLLSGSTVNTTDFITGVTAETVEISDVTYDCVKFSGTVSAVNGIKDKTRIIAYNAKTTQTRIQLSLYNTSTSSRTVLVKGVVEGSTDVQDLASITLGNKEQKTPDYIEFNNAANRTIYIFISSSATDVRFLQVKVIESGTALKTAGQAGYSINFNQGRPFGVKEVDHVFEGLTFQVSSDYQPVNSSYTVAKFKSSSAHVTVASPVTMTVTTANNKTYYVGTSSSATTNETAKTGASEFNLTAGTWYINAGASEVQITNIAFSAPKCAEPVISSLANSDVCDGAGYEALDGTATAADGGSFAYQWYSCDDAVKTNPVELTGENEATYTPSADGFYYVVVTHSLTDYADNVKASDAVKVTTHAGTEIVTPLARVRKTAGADATLTVEATGKNLHYAWKECETIDGSYTDVAGAADNKSLNITVPDGVKYYKVIVTSDCGAAQESIAKVEKFVPVPQATVSTSTTWDFTTCADAEIKLTDGTSPKKGEECLMANIEGVHYDDSFKADALIFAGEYIYRNVTGNPLGAITLKFTTDVQGLIIIRFADNGNNNRCLRVTDDAGVQYSPSSSSNSDIVTYKALVSAGDIEIMGMSQNHASTKQYVRIFSLEFFPYNHRRTGVVGNLGTICWPYNVPVANRKGADFFSIDYFNSSHVIFIEEDGELQAGRPYFFQYTDENMLIQNGETHVDDPSNYRGMYGTFTNIDDAEGKVMLKNNNLYYAPAGSRLGAYRAYIQWDEVEALAPYVEPAGAPLRRRMYINMEHKTPTDFENIDMFNNLDGNKFIKDGKLYILRNGHLYNAQGVRVQ